MTEVKQFLMAMKEQIDVPEKWTKGNLRIGANGQYANAEDACAWCLVGAGVAVDDRKTFKDATKYYAYDKIRDVIVMIWSQEITKYGVIPAFNDAHTTTHPMVMEVIDIAIESCGE